MDTQSRLLQAGTTPFVLSTPRVGLKPIKLLNDAGHGLILRVLVPKEKVTRPNATATAEPEPTTGNVLRLDRVRRHTVGAACADETGGKLIEVCFP